MKWSLEIPVSLSWLLNVAKTRHLISRQRKLDEMSSIQRLILLKPLDINYLCSQKKELQDESLALLTSACAHGLMSGIPAASISLTCVAFIVL